MRGRWDLIEQELAYWQANAAGQTQAMTDGKIKIVDLTREDITPYQVNQMLESLGWERYNEFSGFEGDRYAFYRHDNLRDIVVYGSILTFELAIFLKDDMESISFKKNHVREMLAEEEKKKNEQKRNL